jgi:hypothetical protein
MPASRTVYDWKDKDPAFAAAYARARELGAMCWMEQAMEIGITPQEGDTVTYMSDGSVQVRREDQVAARKLATETLMKGAATFCPKKFGARVSMGSTGEGDEPPTLIVEHVVRKVERTVVTKVLPPGSDTAA